jgi:hypothetical protein
MFWQCLPSKQVSVRTIRDADLVARIQDIVSECLPNAPVLHPATGIDSRAIPHSLHVLYADNLSDQELDLLEQSPNVVAYWRFNKLDAKGTTLVVAADFEGHRKAQRGGRHHLDEARMCIKPVYWHIQVRTSPNPRSPHLPPSGNQVGRAMAVSESVGLFVSAHDVRISAIQESSRLQNRIENIYTRVNTASKEGSCYYYPASPIPFGIHHFQFIDHGGNWHDALVIHTQIGTVGPWIVSEYASPDVIEEKLDDLLSLHYLVSTQIQLRMPIRVAPAPPRRQVTPMPDITTEAQLHSVRSLSP